MDEFKKIDVEETTGAMPTASVSQPSVVTPKKSSNLLLILILVGLIGGSATGFVYAKSRLGSSAAAPGTAALQQNPTSAGSIHAGDTFGANDTATFKDETEGVLQKGGIGGEGTHHLVRGGSASQWVYLTSSVVDLDMFVGDSVHVWGQTNTGKKAGWLMDVGKLKVLQVNAAPADAPIGSGQPE